MLAWRDSPGPLTTQPITASVRFSAPGWLTFHSGIFARTCSCTVLRQLLEELAGGAAATRAGGHHRRERAQAHGLQQFLRDDDFVGARLARLRRQRDADGVADAFLQQHRQRRRRGDDALAADAGLGQAEVQRVVAARGEVAVHRDQFLHAADLGAEHDAIGAAGRSRPRARPNPAPSGSAPRAARGRRPTARRGRGSRPSAASASAWSSEPQLAPMRTGLPCLIASSISVANWLSRFLPKPTLPGLMRYFASASAQAGSAVSSWWPL